MSTVATSTDAPRSGQDALELGRIGSPYGVKGWVHVQSFTDPPERLLSYRDWIIHGVRDGGRTLRLAEGRRHGAGLVARLQGVEDRDRAAQLQGASIRIARSALPKLREREFYRADLIGLDVSNREGVAMGTVAHFVDTPGGAVMVVRGASGEEHWVPATPIHLTKVDLAARHIVVDWPASLDEAEGDEA